MDLNVLPRQEESLTCQSVEFSLGKATQFTRMGDSRKHVGSVISALRRRRRWSAARLADAAGVHPNTVYRFEQDPSGKETDTLDRLEAALGLSPGRAKAMVDSLDAEGELPLAAVLAGDLNRRSSVEAIREAGSLRDAPLDDAELLDDDTYEGYEKDAIPVVSEGHAASQGSFWTDEGVNPEHVEQRTSRHYKVKAKGAYAVKVVGDSMAPVFRQGMELTVSPNVAVRDGDEVFVVLRSGEKLVKYASKAGPGMWALTSANPAHGPRYVKAEDIEVMHVIVHSKRR
jgi:phage repressor protein C with HTH and peptisase S24 domain/plasmid maintenance system antidote protein VapI